MNLFEFANERESIRLLRQAGVSAPWTKNRRMQRFHFGNIFREDDPTTRFIQKHAISWSPDHPNAVLFDACVARMFGALDALRYGILGMLDVDDIFETLEPEYRTSWQFTGRYHIKVVAGQTRMQIVKDGLRALKTLNPRCWESEIIAHVALCDIPSIGPMCANEIIADLRGTSIALTDEYVFPHWGVMAGLGMKPKKLFPLYHDHPKVIEAQAVLCDILEQSRYEWRYPDRPWTLTTAARAALLYGQYISEDYPRNRSERRLRRAARLHGR